MNLPLDIAGEVTHNAGLAVTAASSRNEFTQHTNGNQLAQPHGGR
ncbi:MAG: hypothetical protein ACJ74J_21615 [Blastocatellia bacterium]